MLVRLLSLGAMALVMLLVCAVMIGRALPIEGQIAFQSNRAGNEDILLADVRTALTLNLTGNEQGHESSPSWSPDGNQIVYEYANPGTRAVSAIRVRQLSDGHTHIVFSATAAQPTWSPDGRYITFVTAQALYVALADVTNSRTVREDEFPDYSDYVIRQILREQQTAMVPGQSGSIVDARWSPAHDWIAFTFWDGQSTNAYALSSDCIPACEHPASSLPNSRQSRSVMLTNEGQRATFECRVDDYNGICVMRADGSDLRQIVVSPQGVRDLAPVWRP